VPRGDDHPTLLVDALCFPEGPRWRDGRLWFSDQHDRLVLAIDEQGILESVVEVAQQPSGLGWATDGSLLVVSMLDRRVLALDEDGLVELADLRDVAPWHCNDMLVDSRGRAYVGNFGFEEGSDVESTVLVMIQPDGRLEVVADDLVFPNGMVLADGGRTLAVAETYARRISAFSVAADGTLSQRRILAEFTDELPDGMCLDAEEALWVASPMTRQVMRVRPDGSVTRRIATSPNRPFACALGGHDGHTLFLCTAPTSDQEKTTQLRAGRIEHIRVEVPSADPPSP
jgi:sugar lactone lactonase YvrE